MHLELFDTLADATSPEQFADALGTICIQAGFDHYLVVRLAGKDLADTIQVYENAPEGAGDVQGLAHWSIARMLERMRKAVTPVVFGPGAEAPIELQGYSCGIAAIARVRHGAAIFYFGRSTPIEMHQVITAMQDMVMTASYGIHSLSKFHFQTCPLSHQELQCLRLMLEGLSAKETAVALDVSFRTVEHHLESIRKRFGVDTTAAAAYKALHLGWLDAPANDGVASNG